MRIILALLAVLAACTTPTTTWVSGVDVVLVFSKTEGYRHKSIEAGAKALQTLGTQHGFSVELTEDPAVFNDEALTQYAAVVFLNTTGNILDQAQQEAFERYIRGGGGFVGIHAATDTEYDWPWYGELVGARFRDHPEVQEADLIVIDGSHPATAALQSSWRKKDEWYNFKSIQPGIQVLIEIDESSYEGGGNGPQHPVAWYRNFDGGRSFYTAMGHTGETFRNPLFLHHLVGGIAWAMGDEALASTMPGEEKFTRTVLDFNLDEPMELDELPGEGILFVERRGALKLYDFVTEETRVVAQLPVFYGNEDGLLGLAVDPEYQDNGWIYLFYSLQGEESRQHVSRFTLAQGELDFNSETVLLEIPTDRSCCHSGGALEFGPDGNLYIGVGDNTNPFESDGFSPIDERPGRAAWDAQRSAANSMDLRGKILRIRPEQDGSYSIPEGNLFPPGTPDSRPEIYVMGCRNPFRFGFDSVTGDLYWGDVGPDAGKTESGRGPMGYGEFDRARAAGFWGWPYTRGNNQAYHRYDFATETSGPLFDTARPINDSPNNTGIRDLPQPQQSIVWYSYGHSEEFPWLGSGGVNPMAGPMFHRADFPAGANTFPRYFENTLFLYEWMRDWITVVRFDSRGEQLRRAEPFMPSNKFSHPMDMMFASDGSMYLLEYGQKWNSQNMDARLNRISYDSERTELEVAPKLSTATDLSDYPAGRRLIEGSDCSACHAEEQMVNGPSYREIAERYGNDDMDYLVNKVIAGGAGVWGERHMSAHPQLKRSEVKEMVSYILLLNPGNQPVEKPGAKGHQKSQPINTE